MTKNYKEKGLMKTEIESCREHFGVRWYVKTPVKNYRGEEFMMRCHFIGFKTRKEALAFAKTML
jgi:hypothetical protein